MKYFNQTKLLAVFIFVQLALFLPVPGSADEIVVSGTFTGASNHSTKGDVTVVRNAEGLSVVLGSNFSFDGAPDPKVGFGKNGRYDISTQLEPLRSNKGEQHYSIPGDFDVHGYNEIYIWCEKYSVPLGVAKIK